MKSIYFDNAATSYPKAPGTGRCMADYIDNVGCNVNRGVYSSSLEAERIVYETRELICSLFNYKKSENVIFTKNVTESLNILIKGLLKAGDHVIVSSMEHNAVTRPLSSMMQRGIEVTRIPCSSNGELNAADVKVHIRPNTKAVIMTHASNVCGTILPLEEVGCICRENNIFFIVDAAQTAGFLDIDIEKMQADAIAFTGHKSLLGPQGIGGFIIDYSLIPDVEPLIEGGTGSLSEAEVQPSYMPDRYEGGTINLPGIYGLNNSLKYLLDRGVSFIREKELYLTGRFIDGVSCIRGIRVAGIEGILNRTSVVSLDFEGMDNAEAAYRLSDEFGIMTRCGLHCAPSAHKTINTFPEGTVRFSFSHFNTADEIDYAMGCIQKCVLDLKC